jgi:septum formation protein
LALLAQAGIVPGRVIAPEVDEAPLKGELPRVYALRLALAKAEAVARRETDALVLAADTVVACGRRILPKAGTPDEVGHCLSLLSGRRHQVITALLRWHRRAIKSVHTDCHHARGLQGADAPGDRGFMSRGRGDRQGRRIRRPKAARKRSSVSSTGRTATSSGLPLYETLSLLEGSGHDS